jgi:hypothetical protein
LVHDFSDLDVVAIKFDRKVASLPLSQRKSRQGDEVGVFGYPSTQISFVNNPLNGLTVIPRFSCPNISAAEQTSKAFSPNVNLVQKNFLISVYFC